jgi:hypothetical protein
MRSRRTKLFVSAVALLAAIAVAVGVLASTGPAWRKAQTGSSGPPVRLTVQGRLLWNFEGLLRKTFPGRAVSARYRRGSFWNFACSGSCSPLARWSPYRFTFEAPGGSAFHVSSKGLLPGSFGNYPLQVLVRGHAVACDKQETRFLIEYRDTASFTLACSKPPA